MIRTKHALGLCWTWSLLVTLSPVRAVEQAHPAEKPARDVFTKTEKERTLRLLHSKADALVTVDIILSRTMVFDGNQTPSHERRLSLPGTLVDAAGLTVISHRPLRAGPNRTPFGLDGRSTFTMQDQLRPKEVKIVLADGTELPADIVLKDAELDLAFVRPKKPCTNLTHVDLDEKAQPSMLDDIVSISRLSGSLGRAPVISPGMIHSVISKPRRRYLVEQGAQAGCPVFDDQSRCFGIILTIPEKSADEPFSRSQPRHAILPAADILEEIHQIPAR
jgi:hypothetical protein